MHIQPCLLPLLLLLPCTSIAQLRTPTVAATAVFKERINQETDIDMVFVKGGSFQMGSNNSAAEQPIHTVSVHDYYMSKTEITQAQWLAVMGFNYCYFDKCPTCPAELVSFGDIVWFLDKLSKMVGHHYRLPTEAEWEYAAKGGVRSAHYLYSGSNNINDVAWCDNNNVQTTHPVGKKKPNELGLYDMSGNVLEWCSDWYDSTYYQLKVTDNPKGPATGKYKVARGGSYLTFPFATSVTYRSTHPLVDTGAHWKTLGFRVVRDVN